MNVNEPQAEGGDALQIRVHGSPDKPALIYLPGSHGDWSVIPGFRNQMLAEFCFVEFTYPRTVSWTVEEYGREVAAALSAKGIKGGWLLGESFGSQIAWQLSHLPDFHCQGIILCGGFVRHPFPWGAALFRRICERLLARPQGIAKMMRSYERWVTSRYENTAERSASLMEFKQRRIVADGKAAMHRLRLIQHYDPSASARTFQAPVYYLGGFWDPLVPWYLVRPWLKLHCPGYKDGEIIAIADHNVLFSAPTKSARTIQKWLGRDVEKGL